jgi:hypothetical protein
MKLSRFLDLPIIITAFCLAGIFFVNIGSTNKGNASKQKEINVQDIGLFNKTRAFRITKLEKADKNIQITFVSEYNKSITAFQASIGTVRITEEFIINEKSFIRPGAEFTKIYPVQPMIMEKGISILAVFFEDGTADGDPVLIRELSEIRSGRAKLYEYFLPQIQSVIDSSDKELPKAIHGLRDRINSFNTTNQQQGYFEYGMHEGIQDLLESLNNIENNISNEIKPNLSRLKERYQKMSARLSPKSTVSTN